MAGKGPTVTLTFAGDDRSLGRTLAKLRGETAMAGDSIRKFGTIAALAVPAVGYAAGAVVGLSGVLGLLPSMAFAGGLALGALAIGTQGFGDALKNMDDPAKFAEALQKLSPAARETAIAVRDLKPQFDGLRAAVQNQLFDGIAGELRNLTGALLPTLQSQLVATAGSINSAAKGFTSWLSAPTTVADINTALSGSRGFLDGILRALQPISQAFLDMGVVAAPYMRELGDAIANAAAKFGEFISGARQTGQLGEWIEAGKQAFLSIWETIKNLASTVVDLGVAFGPGLLGGLQLVSGVLASMAGFVRENAAVMVPLITAVGGLVLAYKGLMFVEGVMKAIKASTLAMAVIQGIATAAQVAWNVAMAAGRAVMAAATIAQWLFNAAMLANPITWIVLGIVALIAAIVLLIVHWDKVKAVVGIVVDWIVQKWNQGVALLTAIWTMIKAVAMMVWNAVVAWIRQKVAEAIAVIGWLAALPGKVGAWFGQMKDWAIAKLTELWNWIKTLPGKILAGLSALGQLGARALAWFGGLVTSGIAKGGEILSWMGSLPGRLLRALGNLGSLLLSAGRDLVNGLWNGIKAGWSWITDAVSNLASTLLNAAKSALGIASPSKLFRDEIGRWIPEGMAVGITANTRGLIQSAREMADLAASAAMPAVTAPSMAPAMAGIGSGSAPAPAPVQVVVNVGGSIRSDRELVGLIRDEMDRGGFRGVRGNR